MAAKIRQTNKNEENYNNKTKIHTNKQKSRNKHQQTHVSSWVDLWPVLLEKQNKEQQHNNNNPPPSPVIR